jgi:hypothetical protein
LQNEIEKELQKEKVQTETDVFIIPSSPVNETESVHREETETFPESQPLLMAKDIYSTDEESLSRRSNTSEDNEKTISRDNKITRVIREDEDIYFKDVYRVESDLDADKENNDTFPNFLESQSLLQIESTMERNAWPNEFKYEEVVRNKSKRRNMHGHDCACCSDFYKISGLGSNPIQKLSRHRTLYKQENNTPEGFWDLGFKK